MKRVILHESLLLLRAGARAHDVLTPLARDL